MKKLFILSTLLLSFTCLGVGFVEISSVDDCTKFKMYGKKSLCPSKCIDTPKDFKCEYFKKSTIMGDDLNKPIYEAQSSIVACSSISDCQDKLDELSCQSAQYLKFISNENDKVYCTRVVGYSQIDTGIETLVVDETKKAQYEAEQLTEKTLNDSISAAKKVMECTKDLMAYIGVLNASKSPTSEQVKTIVQKFSPIKEILESGAYLTAKSEIQSIDISGTIMIESERALVIKRLDDCVAK